MPTFPALTAIGTSRTVDVNSLPVPAVLICFAQATEKGAAAVEAAVRARFTAKEVLVGHVVDLHSVSKLFRGVAENILNGEFKKAVEELPANETAEDFVVILPDWDGTFVRAVGLQDVDRKLGALGGLDQKQAG
jgi:hypothetical protein